MEEHMMNNIWRPEYWSGQAFPSLGKLPNPERSNPGILHCRWNLHQLSHKGRPRILEWVSYSFSSRSSQPRNWNGVSCIAGRFFTNWAIREARPIYAEMLKFAINQTYPNYNNGESYIYIYLSIYIYTHTYTCVYTYIYFIYIYMCVCVCVYLGLAD